MAEHILSSGAGFTPLDLVEGDQQLLEVLTAHGADVAKLFLLFSH